MLKKIGFGLLCMAASLNTNAYALENNELRSQGATVEYEFLPNQPLVLTNYMFWTIKANCRITTEDASNPLYVVGLAKKGEINNIPLAAGQSLHVTVYPTEILRLSADSGAKVEITNIGAHAVKATCSTA